MSRNIIHCDIKPKNILRNRGYNPKIPYYGVSRIFENGANQKQTT